MVVCKFIASFYHAQIAARTICCCRALIVGAALLSIHRFTVAENLIACVGSSSQLSIEETANLYREKTIPAIHVPKDVLQNIHASQVLSSFGPRVVIANPEEVGVDAYPVKTIAEPFKAKRIKAFHRNLISHPESFEITVAAISSLFLLSVVVIYPFF